MSRRKILEFPIAPDHAARLRGAAVFADHLLEHWQASCTGNHVDDASRVLRGGGGLPVNFAAHALEHDGDELVGYLLAWNWWTSVAIEGDVLEADRLSAELTATSLEDTEPEHG